MINETIKSEMMEFAKALADCSTKGPITAFCILCSGNPDADQKAYARAVRMGAQKCELYLIGEAPNVVAYDHEWGPVITQVLPEGAEIPTGHVVVINAQDFIP
ncbi:MAG TPA: hypothetical protein VEC35_09370 [Noviherbaspirillum sp.]|nr:hypothetical protein [Noviherbaspirillum sp.]